MTSALARLAVSAPLAMLIAAATFLGMWAPIAAAQSAGDAPHDRGAAQAPSAPPPVFPGATRMVCGAAGAPEGQAQCGVQPAAWP